MAQSRSARALCTLFLVTFATGPAAGAVDPFARAVYPSGFRPAACEQRLANATEQIFGALALPLTIFQAQRSRRQIAQMHLVAHAFASADESPVTKREVIGLSERLAHLARGPAPGMKTYEEELAVIAVKLGRVLNDPTFPSEALPAFIDFLEAVTRTREDPASHTDLDVRLLATRAHAEIRRTFANSGPKQLEDLRETVRHLDVLRAAAHASAHATDRTWAVVPFHFIALLAAQERRFSAEQRAEARAILLEQAHRAFTDLKVKFMDTGRPLPKDAIPLIERSLQLGEANAIKPLAMRAYLFYHELTERLRALKNGESAH